MRLLVALPALMALLVSIPAQADPQNVKNDATRTIVEVLASSDEYSTLAQAVEVAGLSETLSGEGPFTIFAPTNDAFDALPDGLLDSLLAPESRDRLIRILSYHVLDGKVMSADIMGRSVEAGTIEGRDLSIDGRSVDDSDLSVQGTTRMDSDSDMRDWSDMDQDMDMRKRSYGRVENHKAVMVNDAHVVKADIRTSNGVIHGIDKVLIPD